MRDLEGKRILIVEDEPDLRDMLALVLDQSRARVCTAADGRDGLRQFYAFLPDLVLLDLMLPEMHGYEVCAQIRQLSDVPVIMLTASDRDEDVIRGLNTGADDYLIKPINPKVLLARVRAALRRATPSAKGEAPASYDDGHLTVDLDRRRVLVGGEPVQLSATEYRLLAYLVREAGRVRSFDQILDNVWGEGYDGHAEYVHVYISYLRAKLEADPKQPQYFISERGVGYRFEKQAPVRERQNGNAHTPPPANTE